MRGALHLFIGILLGAAAGSSALSIPLIPVPAFQENLTLCFSESIAVLSFSTDFGDPNAAAEYELNEQASSALDFLDVAGVAANTYEVWKTPRAELFAAAQMTVSAADSPALASAAPIGPPFFETSAIDAATAGPNQPYAVWTAGDVRISLAPLTLLSLIPAFGFALADLRKNWRLRKRVRGGCCVRCGFDLRGSMSGRCGECGTSIPESGAVRAPSLVAIWLAFGGAAVWLAIGTWIVWNLPLTLSAVGASCGC